MNTAHTNTLLCARVLVYVFMCLCSVVYGEARAQQTDQTTTLCVQEVEIYLERWEVLGALVDVCVERRKGS